MKKFYLFFSVCLIGMLFSSCNKDDNDESSGSSKGSYSNLIIGTWERNYINGGMQETETIIFKDDKTANHKYYNKFIGGIYNEYDYTWSISNDGVLTLTMKNTSIDFIHKITQIDDKTFTLLEWGLEDEDGVFAKLN